MTSKFQSRNSDITKITKLLKLKLLNKKEVPVNFHIIIEDILFSKVFTKKTPR